MEDNKKTPIDQLESGPRPMFVESLEADEIDGSAPVGIVLDVWKSDRAVKHVTDFDKLRLLLESFGVGFDVDEDNIICEWGENKIEGYSGFYTRFDFDKDGKFIQMGAWE